MKFPVFKFSISILISILTFSFSLALAAEETALPSKSTGPDVKAAFEKSLEAIQKSGQFDKHKIENAAITKEKKEFLLRLTQIIDQKLAILGKQDIPLSVLNGESEKVAKRSLALTEEKKRTASQRKIFEQRVKSLEQDLAIKKQILDLEGVKNPDLEGEIHSISDELDKARFQRDYLKEHEMLVSLKIALIQDYSNLLRKMRKAAIHRVLFTPQKMKIGKKEAAGLGVIFFLFITGLIFRRRVGLWMEWIARGNKDSFAFLRLLIIAAFLYYAAYWVLSLFGYHLLCRYVTKRVAFSSGVVFFSLAIYWTITGLIRQFLIRPTVQELTGKPSKHPYFQIFCTLFGVAAFLFSLYWIFEFWGAGAVGREAVWKLSQKPFFEAGEMKISLWLIVRVAIIVWFFIMISKIIDHFLRERVYPRMRLDATIQYAFSVLINYTAIIVAGFTALKLLGVEIGALTVLAGTVGIGIGFGLQDLAKNFISGLVILVERPVKIGDFVEVGGLPGRVRSINARSTIVDTFDNISVVVPNAEFMSQNVINWSYSDRITRMVLKVGVAYGSDLEVVQKTLMEIALAHPKVLKHPVPSILFEEFGDNSLKFTLQVWTDEPENRKQISSELNFQIDKTFREKNIEIPHNKPGAIKSN